MYTNNAYANAGNLYMNNEVMTASGKKLVTMLYEGAVKFLKRSLMAMDNNDIEGTGKNLVKAQAIIIELMSTLDFEEGGIIAENLHALYGYMYKQLVEANIRKRPENISEVMEYLEELKDTWEKI